jgi:hypothetical protein
MLRINKDGYENDENNEFGRYLGVGVCGIYRQTPTAHTKNICEPLQVISFKVQFSTP